MVNLMTICSALFLIGQNYKIWSSSSKIIAPRVLITKSHSQRVNKHSHSDGPSIMDGSSVRVILIKMIRHFNYLRNFGKFWKLFPRNRFENVSTQHKRVVNKSIHWQLNIRNEWPKRNSCVGLAKMYTHSYPWSLLVLLTNKIFSRLVICPNWGFSNKNFSKTFSKNVLDFVTDL